jgi:formate dehydrogenase major subunit
VLFHKVAEALVAASGPEKTAVICYALGWTQHSKSVQIIRTASILQLLLGNIGRPGDIIILPARERAISGHRANGLTQKNASSFPAVDDSAG